MGFLREPSHLIIILLVLLVLFGGKKLPDAARGLGRSMRIFKSEIREMKNDDDDPRSTASGSTAAEPQARETRPIEGRIVEREQTREAERREA